MHQAPIAKDGGWGWGTKNCSRDILEIPTAPLHGTLFLD